MRLRTLCIFFFISFFQYAYGTITCEEISSVGDEKILLCRTREPLCDVIPSLCEEQTVTSPSPQSDIIGYADPNGTDSSIVDDETSWSNRSSFNPVNGSSYNKSIYESNVVNRTTLEANVSSSIELNASQTSSSSQTIPYNLQTNSNTSSPTPHTISSSPTPQPHTNSNSNTSSLISESQNNSNSTPYENSSIVSFTMHDNNGSISSHGSNETVVSHSSSVPVSQSNSTITINMSLPVKSNDTVNPPKRVIENASNVSTLLQYSNISSLHENTTQRVAPHNSSTNSTSERNHTSKELPVNHTNRHANNSERVHNLTTQSHLGINMDQDAIPGQESQRKHDKTNVAVPIAVVVLCFGTIFLIIRAKKHHSNRILPCRNISHKRPSRPPRPQFLHVETNIDDEGNIIDTDSIVAQILQDLVNHVVKCESIRRMREIHKKKILDFARNERKRHERRPPYVVAECNAIVECEVVREEPPVVFGSLASPLATSPAGTSVHTPSGTTVARILRIESPKLSAD